MTDIKSSIKFGTDGWRGVMADNFTFANVAIVVQAISDWLKREFKKHRSKQMCVAVGYDARFLSHEFAELVSSVLAGNNIQVLLSKDMLPSPALSWGVVQHKCVAGIMITASHNPAKFNGIKIKTQYGGGATNEMTDQVEAWLGQSKVRQKDFEACIEKKKVIYTDFLNPYQKFIKKYVDLKKIKATSFRVIQDVMHGSGGTILQDILKGGRLNVDLLRSNINPSFDGGSPEPVAKYIPDLLKKVKKEKYDVGFVVDGDADRLAAVDSKGGYVNPQRIFGLLVLHMVRNCRRKGSIVKTLCGTTMIDHMAKKLGVELFETPVGFKYIAQLMMTENIIVAGEEAGSIGVQDYIPERDGTLSALLLLEMMAYEQKNLSELLKDMEKEFGCYYYERTALALGKGRFVPKKIKAIQSILGKKVVEVKDFDGIKLICDDESWLMLRPSGTEPIVRAYAESKTIKRTMSMLDFGRELLKAN